MSRTIGHAKDSNPGFEVTSFTFDDQRCKDSVGRV